jgi:hypothetical protein
VSLSVQDGRWHPVVQGNATLVYRAEVDPDALVRGLRADVAGDREISSDEERAYAALEERNAARLRAAGVETTA